MDSAPGPRGDKEDGYAEVYPISYNFISVDMTAALFAASAAFVAAIIELIEKGWWWALKCGSILS